MSSSELAIDTVGHNVRADDDTFIINIKSSPVGVVIGVSIMPYSVNGRVY